MSIDVLARSTDELPAIELALRRRMAEPAVWNSSLENVRAHCSVSDWQSPYESEGTSPNTLAKASDFFELNVTAIPHLGSSVCISNMPPPPISPAAPPMPPAEPPLPPLAPPHPPFLPPLPQGATIGTGSGNTIAPPSAPPGECPAGFRSVFNDEGDRVCEPCPRGYWLVLPTHAQRIR